jgi:hypothetical protein
MSAQKFDQSYLIRFDWWYFFYIFYKKILQLDFLSYVFILFSDLNLKNQNEIIFNRSFSNLKHNKISEHISGFNLFYFVSM